MREELASKEALGGMFVAAKQQRRHAHLRRCDLYIDGNLAMLQSGPVSDLASPPWHLFLSNITTPKQNSLPWTPCKCSQCRSPRIQTAPTHNKHGSSSSSSPSIILSQHKPSSENLAIPYSPHPSDIAFTTRSSPAFSCQQFATSHDSFLHTTAPATIAKSFWQTTFMQQSPFNPHLPQPRTQPHPRSPLTRFPRPPQHPLPMHNIQGAIQRYGLGTKGTALECAWTDHSSLNLRCADSLGADLLLLTDAWT